MKYNDSEIIIQILEKCIELQEKKEADGTNILSLSKEDFMSLFKRIYKNKNVDETIVARLELVFLHISLTMIPRNACRDTLKKILKTMC